MMQPMDMNTVGRADAASYVAPSSVDPKAVSAPVSSSGDKVEISQEGLYVASKTQKVSEMPDVRPEKVSYFKKEISGGMYPPPAIVEGLTWIMGRAAIPSASSA
jgi:hypothetical protein